MESRASSWMPVPGFPGYTVSEDGRIRRGSRELRPATRTDSGRLIVALWRRGGREQYPLARLVLLAFRGRSTDPACTCVRYLDGSPANCRLDNLEWVSLREAGATAKRIREASATRRRQYASRAS